MSIDSMTYSCKSLGEIDEVAKNILSTFHGHRTFVFSGQMGSGKTTLIKSICSALQVQDPTSSPTFALVNEYLTDSELIIYHFDLYRLETIEELLNIGFMEYFDREGYYFIEWPELAINLIPTPFIEVRIDVDEDVEYRTYTCAVVK